MRLHVVRCSLFAGTAASSEIRHVFIQMCCLPLSLSVFISPFNSLKREDETLQKNKRRKESQRWECTTERVGKQTNQNKVSDCICSTDSKDVSCKHKSDYGNSDKHFGGVVVVGVKYVTFTPKRMPEWLRISSPSVLKYAVLCKSMLRRRYCRLQITLSSKDSAIQPSMCSASTTMCQHTHTPNTKVKKRDSSSRHFFFYLCFSNG